MAFSTDEEKTRHVYKTMSPAQVQSTPWDNNNTTLNLKEVTASNSWDQFSG